MYRKVKIDQLPKRERESKSSFEATPDWKRMKRDIDKGLTDDACLLQYAPKDWARIGLSAEPMAGRMVATGAKSIVRFIKKYLAAQGLDYRVGMGHKDGFDNIFVRSRKRKRRSR